MPVAGDAGMQCQIATLSMGKEAVCEPRFDPEMVLFDVAFYANMAVL